MSPLRLHINIDHVATVRNARGTRYPDPVLAAQLCELAGADGITAHIREDRRHIRDADVEQLRRVVTGIFNLEMAATDEMIAIAERVQPDVITLVPERREERTTEGGLDVQGAAQAIKKTVEMASKTGIRVSLFIDPDIEVVKASAALGAVQVELHTGDYCEAFGRPADHQKRGQLLSALGAATEEGMRSGMEVAAGHGLTRHNVGPVAAIEGIVELNIGHAVVADAIMYGLEHAVRDFREAIDRHR